ncbi:MAG TPA: YhdH/YhfP family quinone oxidoreductase [Spirochaetota bacterium]|nr:YhdH/YhfP family quinone oxidoreductase [Spirochaetota bacterium]
MEPKKFKALVVREGADDAFGRGIEERTTDQLPAGELLVEVRYSSLNYKDMLSATGNRGVTKKYPHTPGIDAAGVVVACDDGAFRPGDEVIVTSYDLGMNTSGGFGRYIRVPSAWALPRPSGLSLREAMVYGTAGLTAGLSVSRLLGWGVSPGRGDILVTGAAGGVGSMALSILSHLGFSVVALQGSAGADDLLKKCGASAILDPAEAVDAPARPLFKERYAGCVDTIGGPVLAYGLKSVVAGGAATCCGNIVPELPVTVYPFILRGVSLFGIDSQNCPMDLRREVWGLLAGAWKFPWLSDMASETTLGGLEERFTAMKAGTHRGRTVVALK